MLQYHAQDPEYTMRHESLYLRIPRMPCKLGGSISTLKVDDRQCDGTVDRQSKVGFLALLLRP